MGNILSYRSTDAVDLASPIVTFDEQTIGGSGSSSATLELSKFSESGAETSWESGLAVAAKVGASLDIYGVELGSEVEVKGTYTAGEITTQTVSAQQSLEMRADFGRLQTQFGTSATYHGVPTLRELDDIVKPDGFELREAYPKPFHGSTTIAVELSEATRISLAVYDLLGRRVATVADEVVPAGERLFGFDASGLAAGIYFYEAIARPLGSRQITARETRKLVVVR